MVRSIRLGLLGATALVALSTALPRVSFAALEDTQSYIADARARIAKGDLRGAEIQLRNAAKANPSDPALHIQLAQLYLDMQNLPAAEVEARLARQYKGPPDQVDPLLAEALFQESKYDELFRDVTPGNRGAKSESQVRLYLGLAYLALQELDRAEPMLRDSERLDSSAAEPKAAMAELLLTKHDVAGAQREIAAAEAIAPNDDKVIRVTAQVLRSQGNTDAAIAKLTDLLAKNPDDVTGLAARADAFMSQNKLDAAKADLDRARKVAPGNATIVLLDGILLARQQKWKAADGQLSQVDTAFSAIPYGYYLEGFVKYQLGQYEQAAANFSKYIARVPDAKIPRQLLARIALTNHHYAAAVDDVKPLVDKDPTDATSVGLLAQAYIDLGERNQAIDLYAQVAKAQPDNASAAANAALMEVREGKVQEGLSDLDRLAGTAAGAPIAGPALVTADIRTGHVSDAESAAEALVKRNPKDLVAQDTLGMVRMVQGRYAEAAAIFKSISDKDPTLLGARRGLADADVALGKVSDAKGVLQALLQEKSDSLLDAIALARLDARQKDYTAAAQLLKTTQQAMPTDPAPGLALLQIYADAKDWTDAVSYGHSLEGQFPANPQIISVVASARSELGDAKGAVDEYSALARNSPHDDQILLSYAKLQYRAGDKSGARDTIASAVAADPTNFDAMQALVEIDFETRGLDAALATARSFSVAQPVASAALASDVLARAKRTDDAIATLQSAINQDPVLQLVGRLTNLTYAKGQHDEAEKMLIAWLNDHGGPLPGELLLADFYMRDLDYAKARAVYEDAYKQSSTNVLIDNNLAVIYSAAGDRRAQAIGEQAYYLVPTPKTADTYGWSLVATGEAAKGLSFERTAAAALPKDNEVQYHLAVALKDTGNVNEARAVLEHILGSDTQFRSKAEAQRLFDQLRRG